MYAQVALPLSSYQTFTYHVPGELNGRIDPGCFVRVPFRNREAVGVVTSLAERPSFTGSIKSLFGLKEGLGRLPPDLWETLVWMSRYYFTPLGMVLKTALPLEFSEPHTPRPQLVVRITTEGRLAWERRDVKGPKQQAVLATLYETGQPIPVQELAGISSGALAVCRRLEVREWAEIERQPVDFRFPEVVEPIPGRGDVTFTPEQQMALETLLQARDDRKFTPLLLQGVTGSGKTEVYLEAARRVIAAGGAVLVLVPEIVLTPQVAERFRAAFGNRVALWHSHISRPEKRRVWEGLQMGRLAVVVGARSALFAPLPGLQLLIVDEEQESSYKQEDPAPRYHARHVALMRARYANAVILLASATP
ncbi:DEAD/DEAH box helicase, partial [Candidatus Neomarinimicrobiota bacterium]